MNMQVKSKDIFVEITYTELKDLIIKANQRDILVELLKDDKEYQKIKMLLMVLPIPSKSLNKIIYLVQL